MKVFILRLVIILLYLVIFSCKTAEKSHDGGNLLDGKWSIYAVYRNDKDITDGSDFSKFFLQFNEDGTYVIKENFNLPLTDKGHWNIEPHKKVQNIIIAGSVERRSYHMTFFPMRNERIAQLAFDFVSSSNTSYHYVFRKCILSTQVR